jgi:sulfatase maturation enzyme AslB (radical SAM superfamily)
MNNYFCVLPFFGYEYTPSGFTTPCCLLPKDTNIKQLQTEMLSRQRPVACQKCWKLEDQGLPSNRQIKNSTFDLYKNRDLNYIEDDCREGKFNSQIIQLYTSNLCNSTCITCGPQASTAWATLKKIKTFEIIDQTILDSLVYEDLVILTFVGGEPFYENRNFEILQKLIDVGNTDCYISFVTNGSTNISDKQINILKQFKNLDICLSIDGIGPVFEYLRYPLKWDKLLENIKLYRGLGIYLSVSYTISNLNVLYHEETVRWFNSENLEYNHNLINYPEYFAPAVLPQSVKDQYPQLSAFFTGTSDGELLKKFYAEIALQDELKKIKLEDYLPKVYNLLKCGTK